MLKQAQHIKERFDLLSQNITRSMGNSDVQLKNLMFSTAIEDIPKILGYFKRSSATQDNFKQIFLLSYKVDEKFGPTLFYTFNLTSSQYKEQIDTIGSLYVVTIGQGQRYNQGLFGPFPFGVDNLRSLVFRNKIFDPDQSTGRNRGFVYFMLCIIFPDILYFYFE